MLSGIIGKIRIYFFFLFIAVFPLSTSAHKIIVSPTHSHLNNLNSAIQIAQPHDTILVKPGLYYGNVIIDKPLTLLGEKGAIISAPTDTGDAVKLIADSCFIQGFIIRGGGHQRLNDNAGLKIYKSHYNVVRDCFFEDNLFGIYLYSSHWNLIRKVTIHGRDNEPEEDRGNGIHLHDSHNNHLDSLHIYGARDGIYFDFADSNYTSNSLIEKVRYGLHFMYSDYDLFEYNLFRHNVAGVALMYSDRGLTFRYNIFAHNVGYRAYGVLYKDVRHALSEYNLVVDNTTGLFFDMSHYNVVRYNLIAQSGVAIRYFLSSEGTVIYGNNFIDNLSNLVSSGGGVRVKWENEKEHMGNYWSNFHGYDLDGDGISDIPHRVQGIFDHLQGEYPFFRLYVYSPAAQALIFAEHLLPFIEKAKHVDHAPLMHPIKIPDFLIKRLLPPQNKRSSIFMLSFSFLLLSFSVALLYFLKKWAGQEI